MSKDFNLIFDNFVQEKKYDEILKKCREDEFKNFNQRYFFEAVAYFELGRIENAIEAVDEGLRILPLSPWGILLKYKILKKDSSESALDFICDKILLQGIKKNEILIEAINELVKKGDYIRASLINEKRDILHQEKSKKYCVCIQVFNKPDTLIRLFDSLLDCENKEHFHVLILQDSHLNSRKEHEYADKVKAVSTVVAEYSAKLANAFESLEFMVNPTNMGTAPTCRKLLSYAADKYEGFLFLEDDCVLTKDSLAWTFNVLENLISDVGPHFGTCESIFFDYSRGNPPDDTDLAILESCAEQLSNKYCHLGFVPSTCFITSSSMWGRYKSLRSFPKGPESLNKFFETVNGRTIFPLLPRVSDIGMEHEDGYSTANLGKGNVKEIKHTYLTSNDTPCYSNYKFYDGNLDLLFSATSKINKEHIVKLKKELTKS